MIRKLCLVLACLLALSSIAFAEETPAYVAEDFSGEWLLNILVQDDYHMNMQAWGFHILLTLNDDGAATLAYSEDDSTEMSWRFDAGRAYITGYSADGEIEITFGEDGSLCLADEIGAMYFVRPAVEDAA
ncbi:MAG: hypothetical protein IJ466_08675 [Clostridia bacterium]|nr:hypothetical protein [Clostridia bacterium]